MRYGLYILVPITVILSITLSFLCVHRYDHPLYKVPVETTDKKLVNTNDGTILAPKPSPILLKDIPEDVRVKAFIWITSDGHFIVCPTDTVTDTGSEIVWHKDGKWYGIFKHTDDDILMSLSTRWYSYNDCMKTHSCEPITLVSEK